MEPPDLHPPLTDPDMALLDAGTEIPLDLDDDAGKPKEIPMFTLAEIRLLIEAVDTLTIEYGDTPERIALLAHLRDERDRHIAEIESERI
jgi:hypothetical protein